MKNNTANRNAIISVKSHTRLVTIMVSAVLMLIGLALILKTFNDNIVFFYTPTNLLTKQVQELGQPFRIGGVVKQGSITKDGGKMEFIITDFTNECVVVYEGITPALFKEGQGAVAFGNIKPDGVFVATEILAKHDENYVPRELQSIMPIKRYQR